MADDCCLYLSLEVIELLGLSCSCLIELRICLWFLVQWSDQLYEILDFRCIVHSVPTQTQNTTSDLYLQHFQSVS